MDEEIFIKNDNNLNVDQKEFARHLRKNPTEAEAIMWRYLRKKVEGYKFRRQHCIGDYIVDFVNLSSGTIIEIDGGYHDEEKQIIQDELRTKALLKRGYTVLRFRNAFVISQPDEVVKTILNHIKTK